MLSAVCHALLADSRPKWSKAGTCVWHEAKRVHEFSIGYINMLRQPKGELEDAMV
jgi:hypothetical protein